MTSFFSPVMARLSSLLKFLGLGSTKNLKQEEHWRNRLAFTYALTSWVTVGFVVLVSMFLKSEQSEILPTQDTESLHDPADLDEDEILEDKRQIFTLITTQKDVDPKIPLDKIFDYFFSSTKK